MKSVSLVLAAMLPCVLGVASLAHAGTARSTLTVSATILPGPCSAQNTDPNCIPVSVSTRQVGSDTVFAQAGAIDASRATDGIMTLVTYSY